MKTKSKEQIEKEVEAYLNKTAKHLFVTGDYLYKIIPFKKDEVLYYVIITMGNGKVQLLVREAVTDSFYKWYGNGTLGGVKDILFPSYGEKTKSIPNFRKMRELVELIKQELTVDNNTKLITNIQNKLPEFEVVK